jgi:hypothetical protein
MDTVILIVIVLLIMVAAGGLGALALRRTERRTIDLSDPIDRIDVRLAAGRLEVSGAAGEADSGVHVERTASWVISRPSIVEEVEGRTLRISVRGQSLVGRGGAVDYRISAPASVAVRAVTGAGSIEVDGVDGAIDLGTAAGEIRVRSLAGPARLDTRMGRIKATGLVGAEMEASSTTGTVELEFAAPPEHVDVSTSTGSLVVAVPGGPYRVDARTGAGNTEVGVATDPDATRSIRARSSAGSVTIKRR